MTAKPTDINKIFASNADPNDIEDPDSGGVDKYQLGWIGEKPPYETFNYVLNKSDRMLGHINEYGVAEWDSVTSYPIGGWARSTVDNEVYVSLSTNNQNNEPSSSSSQWASLYSTIVTPLNLGTASTRDIGTSSSQVPLNSNLGAASIRDTGTSSNQIPLNSDLGTAATKDTGTGSSQIPLNSNLGTASTRDVGTSSSQIPLNSNLGTAATKDTGTSSSQVPLNSDLGTASTRDIGTSSSQIPLNSNLGTASIRDTGTSSNQIPLNSSLGTAATKDTGTGSSQIPLNSDLPTKAWVLFQASGTVGVINSSNVSSVTDRGIGRYTVNLATAQPNVNYTMSGSTRRPTNVGATMVVEIDQLTASTTSSVQIETRDVGNILRDPSQVSVIITGD